MSIATWGRSHLWQSLLVTYPYFFSPVLSQQNDKTLILLEEEQ